MHGSFYACHAQWCSQRLGFNDSCEQRIPERDRDASIECNGTAQEYAKADARTTNDANDSFNSELLTASSTISSAFHRSPRYSAEVSAHGSCATRLGIAFC